MDKIKKSKLLKILLVFAVALLIFFLTPIGQTTAKTLIIMPEFIPNSPVKTINIFTPKPVIKEVVFKSGSRDIHADLWLPKEEGKFPAAVLHLGVDIDRKDPRVQELSNAFARTGVATLVPNIPSLGRRRVLAEAKEDLIASFTYLKSQPNISQEKLGFIGFCASGGLVLVAAQEPKIADQVRYIVTVNPYYNLSSLYENLTLRQIEADGETHPWQPNFKTVEIYNRETIGLLKDEMERQLLNDHLTLIGETKLEKGKFLPLSRAKLNLLSKEAKFTYDLLTNNNPDKVSFYKMNATREQKNFLKELSPSTKIGNLKAKPFILMDKNNIYIPYTEAKLLDEALGGKEHLFVETKILPAGDLAENLPLKDYFGEAVKIFRFVYTILSEIA